MPFGILHLKVNRSSTAVLTRSDEAMKDCEFFEKGKLAHS